MNKIKVKLIGKGTEEEPYTVNLPTWTMVGGPDYVKKECYVIIPDDEIMMGHVDQAVIRKKYKKNWSNFKVNEVEIWDM